MTEIKPEPIWATNLYFAHWSEHPQQAPDLIAHLYQLQASASRNIASGVAVAAKPRRGLFESRFDLLESDGPGLQQLRAFICNALCQAVSHVNGGRVPADQLRARPVESWCHITNDSGFHDSHFHHQCSWCGIYYLQAGDTDEPSDGHGAPNGVNRFYPPLRTGGSYHDYGTEYLRDNHFDVPRKDGTLVMFPSYLLHSALPYRGQSDRIIIAFNAQVKKA